MKKKTILYLCPFVSMLILTVGCGNNDTVADDSTPTTTGIEDDVPAGCTAFCMEEDDNSMTRTSMRDHKYLKGGTFMWETGDKIWVENGSTRTGSKRSNITKSQATARFYVPGNFPNSSYKVYYTGENSNSGTNVVIKNAQVQQKPNDARHFGTAGDCGTATATRNGGRFKFNLDHKVSYLCLMPRIENAGLAANVYLTKIVVKSNNNIAGTYTLNFSGLTGNGSSNTITLTTKGSGNVPGPWDTAAKKQKTVPAPGFQISPNKGDVSKSAYMVIAPGTHTLTVQYTIKDPATEVEATITKTLTAKNYEANKVYDVTANLTTDIEIYRPRGDYYYMWDAQVGYHYWKNHENSQPYVNEGEGAGYPVFKNFSDPRMFNSSIGTNATRALATIPNINEMCWYVWYGDPHWDGNKLWSHLNHLYKGGMWFLKKQHINGFNPNAYKGSNGSNIDFRGYYKDWYNPKNISKPSVTYFTEGDPNWKKSPIQGRPSNTAKYFFLAAAGYYNDGKLLLKDKEYFGAYWSSTTISGNDKPAFCLHFDNITVGVECDLRGFGYLAGLRNDSQLWFQ